MIYYIMYLKGLVINYTKKKKSLAPGGIWAHDLQIGQPLPEAIKANESQKLIRDKHLKRFQAFFRVFFDKLNCCVTSNIWNCERLASQRTSSNWQKVCDWSLWAKSSFMFAFRTCLSMKKSNLQKLLIPKTLLPIGENSFTRKRPSDLKIEKVAEFWADG